MGFAERERVVGELKDHPRPVLAQGSPGIWAHDLRGFGCDWLVCDSGGVERARDEGEAMQIMMGEIVQRISNSPDGGISIWFLSVARAWEEFQINGALAALESAREERLIDHLGLHVAGRAMAVASLWRFHDAFDVVLCPPGEEIESVLSTARDRRVGFVQDGGESLGFGPVLKVVDCG